MSRTEETETEAERQTETRSETRIGEGRRHDVICDGGDM